MSITSDIRAYADSAVSEGRKALSTAQAQLNDVTGQAGDIVGKYGDTVGKYADTARANASDIAKTANDAVKDLRDSAERVLNIDAVRTAVEPYLTQVKGYGDSVADRAEELFATLRKDPRFAKVLDTAESVSGVVYGRVQSLTGIGSTAGKPSPAAKASRKPATTKPATKATSKPAATRPTTKSTTRKTTASKTTAAKATASKSAPKPTSGESA